MDVSSRRSRVEPRGLERLIPCSQRDPANEHREGVSLVPDLRTQLMFVTVNKDDASFASHIQYKDHAVSADLFHWEAPNNWRQHTQTMLECIGVGPDASEHRLLFVRERSSGVSRGRSAASVR